ncbi:hypothetical protein PVK06_030709 [Gossypium arboreum]|uniref:Uncharacterized protein n=1 Tax=Gossypium arboreum TaxID=29729 RepID=A0ABR0NP12_GOSAR|nr:hypothetical protein PVK06_030709 [Gossypium arboreum]
MRIWKANSLIDVTGSTFTCYTMPVLAFKMDVLTLLDEVLTNEGDTTTPPKTVAGKKNQKSSWVEESTQGTEDSDCPQLSWRRLRKRPALPRANNSLVPALPLVPILPMEPTNSANSQVHIADLSIVEIP